MEDGSCVVDVSLEIIELKKVHLFYKVEHYQYTLYEKSPHDMANW